MKKFVKSIFSLTFALTMAFSVSGCNSNQNPSNAQNDENESNSNDPIKIGIVQLIEHDALDSAREGFIDTLADAGYEDGENVIFDIQNAQGDQSNLKTISQKFVNNNSDLIFAISTQAAQSVASETTEIPILGSAITDYVSAGLVDSNEVPGKNVSGTSDAAPVIEEQIKLISQLAPEAKTLGIMYTSSETNSQVQAEEAQQIAENLGFTCEIGTITSTNDIAQAVQSIVGKVDAIYIPTDNLFASAMPVVASVTEESKTPVVCGDTGMVSSGGLITIGTNFYVLGEQTGKMAIEIIEGKNTPDKMPIQFPQTLDLCINLDNAKAIGLDIPQDLINRANIITENGNTTKFQKN